MLFFITFLRSSKQRQSFESYGPGTVQSPGAGQLFEAAHVPATPPATPPSDQEKTTATVQFPTSSSDSAVVSSSTEPDKMDAEQSESTVVLEQRRVAVQAMAYAQACHAMQTFISRSLPLQVRPGPSHSNKMGKQGKLFSDRMLKVLTGT